MVKSVLKSKTFEKMTIQILDYDDRKIDEHRVVDYKNCAQYKNSETVTWINVDGCPSNEQLAELANCFGLHQLIVKDIQNFNQRPKYENMGEYLFVSAQIISNVNKRIETEHVSFIVGDRYLLSFQEKNNGDVFDPIRVKLQDQSRTIRKSGSDYLLYSLLSAIIDHYFATLETLGERIEILEDELIARPDQKTLHEIHDIKQKMLFIRRSVWPLREVVIAIDREESHLINKSSRIYFRDLYDQTIQVIDLIEMYREMVSGMIDIYLSSINNRMNEVMKVLTVIATIFMPLTFMAGVYGMNFHFMPELSWRYGYPFAIGLMSMVAIIMLIFFRRKKWM